jgi:UDP-glucose 4-epimerase
MSLHVVIKGATGFIGSAIAREFVAAGVRVTMLIRSSSQLGRVAELSPKTLINVDGLSFEELVEHLSVESPNVFIHCGWRGVEGRDRNQAFQISDNLSMTLDSVDLAAEIGCKQWIGFGSQAEYGNQNRRLDEAAPLAPTTLYGKAKLAAGVASLALCEAKGMAGAWVRVFSTYGPGDAPNWFIPYVTQEFLAGRQPKLTKCEQFWDYLFVEDAARAVCALADQSAAGVFNLGSGVARPLRAFVEAIRAELATDLEPVYGAIAYRPDQVMHLEADISLLTATTGWRPETTLVDGIKRTIAFEVMRGS